MMTIVFSLASPQLIVQTVDSAITRYFPSWQEYSTGCKSYSYPGVGCVATWGARDGNQIRQFLERHEIKPENFSVEELASLVHKFLTEEYRPHESSLDDVGYHVAGFDRSNRARLFHVFYGFDRPRQTEQKRREYKWEDQSPAPSATVLLYNGRNDLAEIMVLKLVDEVRRNAAIHFDLTTAAGLVRFGDFIARFAGELTPEVGPPFLTRVISPRNEPIEFMNEKFCPLNSEDVERELRAL